MKHLKQFLLVVLVLVLCGGMAGCKEKVTTIGILQLATHSALDDAREGFVQALKDAGYEDGKNIKLIVKNPENDMPTLAGYATELVRECDIVLGIATKAAVQLQTARKIEQTDTKILFTAVTNAVTAGLVEANDVTNDNITGTHDMNPVNEQIDLVKEILPSVKKIAVLYNISEVNSKVQFDLAKTAANAKGIEVMEKTVSETAEISIAARAAIEAGAEALYLPTDNLIASNMPAIISVAEEMNVPTICGESGMVIDGGGSITYSINYKALGVVTGNMAVSIIQGTKVSKISVTSVDASGVELVINEESFNEIGLAIPQSLKDKLNK